MKNDRVFERYETKYLMSRDAYALVKKEIDKHMLLDEFGHSLICNIYYDTPDFRIISRSLDHPVYKEKIRARSYGIAGADSPVYIELKKKYDDVVYKRRIMRRENELSDFFKGKGESSDQISRELRFAIGKYKNLAPRVYLSYEREAYCSRDGEDDFRLTVDEHILYRTDVLSLRCPPSGIPVIPDNTVLMETKCSAGIPFWMARALSEAGVYQCSFSKYGRAYLDIMKQGENDNAAVV